MKNEQSDAEWDDRTSNSQDQTLRLERGREIEFSFFSWPQAALETIYPFDDQSDAESDDHTPPTQKSRTKNQAQSSPKRA